MIEPQTAAPDDGWRPTTQEYGALASALQKIALLPDAQKHRSTEIAMVALNWECLPALHEADRRSPPTAEPSSDIKETARAWMADHIEGYNWTQPRSTEQRVGALAALLRAVRTGVVAPDDGWRVDRPGWYWVRHYAQGPWFPSEWTGGQWTLLLMGGRYTSASDLWCPIEIGPTLSPPSAPREGESDDA